MTSQHISLWLLLLFVQQLTWSNVNTEAISSDDESLRGINYGVVTEMMYQVQAVEEFWTHTIFVELPYPHWRDINLDLCQQLNDTDMCTIVESLQNQTNHMLTRIKGRLDDLHASICETFPDEPMFKVKNKAVMTFNYASDITKHESSSATEKDMRLLQKHIKELGTINGDLSDKFHVHSLPFSSVMKHRVLDLDRLAKNIERNYEDLAKMADSILTGLSGISQVISLYLNLLNKLTAYENQHQHLNNYLYMLKIRKLSPAIAGPNDLKSMFEQVESQLEANYPSFRLVHLNSDYYYLTPEIFPTRHGNNMFITIRLPITNALNWLHLYKLHVTTMPVHDQTLPHYTILTNYPEYLALSENYRYYAELSAEQVEECKIKQGRILHCPYSIPLKSVSKPTCALAIFFNETDQILELCKFDIIQGTTPPAIQEIAPTKLLMTNCSDIFIQCRDYNMTKAGSLVAIVQLGCKCSLTSGDFTVSARISDCDEDVLSEVLYPVNLPVINQMGSHRMKRDIHGNTLFTHPQKFHVSQIKPFQYNYSNIMADGTERPLDLKKVAESVNKGELVFHTLAERMLNGDVQIAHCWWSKAFLWDILNIFITTAYCVCMACLLVRINQLQKRTSKESDILNLKQ